MAPRPDRTQPMLRKRKNPYPNLCEAVMSGGWCSYHQILVVTGGWLTGGLFMPWKAWPQTPAPSVV